MNNKNNCFIISTRRNCFWFIFLPALTLPSEIIAFWLTSLFLNSSVAFKIRSGCPKIGSFGRKSGPRFDVLGRLVVFLLLPLFLVPLGSLKSGNASPWSGAICLKTKGLPNTSNVGRVYLKEIGIAGSSTLGFRCVCGLLFNGWGSGRFLIGWGWGLFLVGLVVRPFCPLISPLGRLIFELAISVLELVLRKGDCWGPLLPTGLFVPSVGEKCYIILVNFNLHIY